MKQRGWVISSGLLWLVAGGWLLYKGLRLIAEAAFQPGSLCDSMQGTLGSAQQAASLYIAIGLLIGFLKARFVFVKTVRRVVSRIAALPLPISFSQAYAPSYWMLIGGMMALGMGFRFLPIPIDVRGMIDVAIGSALVHGAFFYFRAARTLYA